MERPQMEKIWTKYKNHWPLQNTFYGSDICNIRYYLIMVLSIIVQHREITAGFLPQRPWFNSSVSHAGFIADKVAVVTMIKQGQKNAT